MPAKSALHWLFNPHQRERSSLARRPMVQQEVSRFSSVQVSCARFVAALAVALSAGGCAQEDFDPASVDAAESGLVRPSWTRCAKQGQHCAFSGKRNVRYGTTGRYVTKAFSGGVHCDGAVFGTRSRKTATCDFDANNLIGAAGGPAPTPAPGSGAAGGAAGSGAAGSPHAGHTTAGSGGTGGSTGMAAGPYIDVAAIPMGEPGISYVDIKSTTEKPAGSDGTGAFRTNCGYSHMLYDDPLVFPNKPGAAHLHAFFGNTDVDAYSTQDSVRNSGNSTCRGGIANRSSYWVPALIDAAGKPVKPNSMDVYYKSGYNGIAAANIKPFPSGLRVIAGSAKSSSAQTRAYWGCHANYIGHPGSIPQCKTGDQLVMVVEFPQCWDGVNLDSADHVSHMAYPSNNRCPSTHPVAIPAITFNVLYPVRDVKGWRLSSDMYDASLPGGFSAHADWFEGWDPKVSEAFVKNCINPAVDCHSHLLGDGRTIL